VDLLERDIHRNVLLGLIAELYQSHLSDAIAVKEWLQAKLDDPVEGEDEPPRDYLPDAEVSSLTCGISLISLIAIVRVPFRSLTFPMARTYFPTNGIIFSR
jgi:hypothetical protein